MPPATAAAPLAATEPLTSPSLEASDGCENGFVPPSRYCPGELLGSFTLLMAGHGRCVSSAMMLGDREYALWQLARAHAVGDVQLRALAGRLFAWYDAHPPQEQPAPEH